MTNILDEKFDAKFDDLFTAESTTVDCETHGTQTVEYLSAFMQSPVCPVCETEREQQQKNEREKALLLEKATCAGVTPKFLPKSFDDFHTGGNAAKQYALDTVKAFADNFASTYAGTDASLVLIGGLGTGKTHLACCLVKRVIKLGFVAKKVSAKQLVRSVRKAWNNKNADEEAIIKAYAEYDLLVIDEVGKGAGSENERDIIGEVIDCRYEHLRPTVILSNCNVQTMGKYIDERSVDRLHENGNFVAMDWNSNRRDFGREVKQ